VGEAVQRIADDAIYPPHARLQERVRHVSCCCTRHGHLHRSREASADCAPSRAGIGAQQLLQKYTRPRTGAGVAEARPIISRALGRSSKQTAEHRSSRAERPNTTTSIAVEIAPWLRRFGRRPFVTEVIGDEGTCWSGEERTV